MTKPYHLHANLPICERETVLLAYKIQQYPRLMESYKYYKNQEQWKIVVKDVDRGFCNNEDKLIVLPLWGFKHRNPEFIVYYLAHELAHIGTDSDDKPHGVEWRQKFMFYCPKHLVKFDLDYRLGNTQ